MGNVFLHLKLPMKPCRETYVRRAKEYDEFLFSIPLIGSIVLSWKSFTSKSCEPAILTV